MRCEVLKTFKRRGEPQLPGSIIEVPQDVIVKLAGYVRILANSSADSHPSADWRPEPRAWLTETGELLTIGVFPGEWPDGGLAPEIIKLTFDNLPLQAKLLRECVGRYSGPKWKALVEDWEERAAIMQFDGNKSRAQAEQDAAKLYRMEAFLPELRHKI